jgi:hypothetical protein
MIGCAFNQYGGKTQWSFTWQLSREGKMLLIASNPMGDGNIIKPAIFGAVKVKHFHLCRTQQESLLTLNEIV